MAPNNLQYFFSVFICDYDLICSKDLNIYFLEGDYGISDRLYYLFALNNLHINLYLMVHTYQKR